MVLKRIRGTYPPALLGIPSTRADRMRKIGTLHEIAKIGGNCGSLRCQGKLGNIKVTGLKLRKGGNRSKTKPEIATRDH